MKRYGAQLDFSSPPAGSFETLSINLPQGGDVSGTLQVFGDEVNPQARVGITALTNGQVDGSASWAFDADASTRSGSDAFMSRVRSVELQGFDALLDKPAQLPEVDIGPIFRNAFTLLPLEANLGDYLPTAADCEAEGRLGPKSNVTFCREMLSASQSVTLLLHPGPGLVQKRVPRDYDVTGQTVGQVLNDLLLTNGVRWWLEEDVLVVDGRALPVGNLNLTGSDAVGASVQWREEPRTPAPEPLLADFLARCAESIESEDGEGGTFETFENGTYRTENRVIDDGISVRTWTELTKVAGRVTKEVSGGDGRMAYPNDSDRVGPKYRKLTTRTYHHAVPDALVEQLEEVYAYAAYTDLTGSGSVPAYAYTGADLAWLALLEQSPYLTNRTRVIQSWHAEGWLRRRIELKRELVGMLADRDISDSGGVGSPGDFPLQIQFLYRDTITDTTWTPVGGGMWLESGTVVEGVDRPISFAPVTGVGITLVDSVGVGTLTSSLPFSRVSDQSPETVSLPEPDCSGLSCAGEANRDYQRALQDWEASESNNASRRTYTVSYNHLRPRLQRGGLLGGGLIVDVSHSVGRNQPGMTSATVWKAG